MVRRLAVLLLVSVMMTGCAGERERGEVQWVTTADGRKIPQGGTLVTGLITDVNSLNDYTASSDVAGNIISLMFLKLANLNPDLTSFSPELAQSWEFSEDRKTLTFHLRTDVRWWDGETTDARDVVFSQKIARNPDVGSPLIRWKEHITKVTAPDDSTVVFTFNQVYPYQLMDAVTGVIIPEHILNDVAPEDFATVDFNRNPVGNGPFRFESWKQQERIELGRNPDYYKSGQPHLDRIVFQIVPDRTAQLTRLRSGEIDFLTDVPPREYQKLEEQYHNGQSEVKPYEYLGRTYDFIVWNTIDPDRYDPEEMNTLEELDQIPNPLFADGRARRAMTHAIDRSLVREAVGYGLFVEMTGPMAPILWAHDNSLEPLLYDPEEARRLLRSMGWIDEDNDGVRERDGSEFRFTLKTNAGNTRREQVATLIQDMLREVGVDMEIRQVEGTTFFNDLMGKQFNAALVGWSTSLKVDFTAILHSKSVFDKLNFSSYRNPEFDRLNDRAKNMLNRGKAKQFWSEAQQVLIQDQPYTWLYYMKSAHGLHERFRNVIMDERGAYINLEEWWVPLNERKY